MSKAKTRPLSESQWYLMWWARENGKTAIDGSYHVYKFASVPPFVRKPDGTRVEPPAGIGFHHLRALERRGYFTENEHGIFRMTPAGRAVLGELVPSPTGKLPK